MIALARQRHPQIHFYEADISKWIFPKKYDFISAWDSAWHLPLELQEPVLQKICEGLTDHGIFIFTTGGLDDPHEKSDSSMGIEVSFGVLGIPKTLELLTGSAAFAGTLSTISTLRSTYIWSRKNGQPRCCRRAEGSSPVERASLARPW